MQRWMNVRDDLVTDLQRTLTVMFTLFSALCCVFIYFLCCIYIQSSKLSIPYFLPIGGPCLLKYVLKCPICEMYYHLCVSVCVCLCVLSKLIVVLLLFSCCCRDTVAADLLLICCCSSCPALLLLSQSELGPVPPHITPPPRTGHRH